MAHSRWVTKVGRSVVRLEFMAALRAMRGPPSTLQFAPHDRGTRHHRAHLAEGDIARQVFQSAIRRDDDALGRMMRQRAADARRDRLGRLYRHIGEVEY